jgi:hypothetical protein
MKDVYEAVSGLEKKIEEKLKDVPNRREVKLWIALGLLGGQTVASLIAAYITHLSPPEQAQALYHLFF